MNDEMGTYGVAKIDDLVKDNMNDADKVEVPEEIATQMREDEDVVAGRLARTVDRSRFLAVEFADLEEGDRAS